MALDYKSSLSRYRRYLQLMQTQPLWSTSMWVIMSLILMIVLTWLALRPTLITISGLFGQINQQKELSERLDAKILAVRNALQELDSISPDLPLLQEMLPITPRWEMLTEEIYQAATNSGIGVSSITVEKIPTALVEKKPDKNSVSLVPTGIVPIAFSVSAYGDYQQLVDFVSRIEKSKRMLLFSNTEINIDKTGRQNLNISGEAGFMPEAEL